MQLIIFLFGINEKIFLKAKTTLNVQNLLVGSELYKGSNTKHENQKIPRFGSP